MDRRVLLVSLYELGRQPFGVASAAAWLGAAGCRVSCLDLAVEPLDPQAVEAADVIAVHLPMHTATRLAVALVPRLRALNPAARLCFFGLYAPMNSEMLRSLGAEAVIGGEFEAELVRMARAPAPAREPLVRPAAAAVGGLEVRLERLAFRVPERRGLPGLEAYTRLEIGEERRLTGYTEATRGCRHRCAHCPVVPVYDGALRVVQRDVVIADVAAQVAAGARHITFGDPDFFNGPEHGMRILRELHGRFPDVTYDVTIKIEHLLRHRRRLPELRDTGCLFVTSAAEAVDDGILRRLDKGHTREDIDLAVHLARAAGLQLVPTFVPFTPWTTLAGYAELLDAIAELELVADVVPVQYAIRLLLPAGSLLLEQADVAALARPFDAQALCHPWSHPDAAVDELQLEILRIVSHAQRHGADRAATFAAVRAHTLSRLGRTQPAPVAPPAAAQAAATGTGVRLSEPWFC